MRRSGKKFNVGQKCMGSFICPNYFCWSELFIFGDMVSLCKFQMQNKVHLTLVSTGVHSVDSDALLFVETFIHLFCKLHVGNGLCISVKIRSPSGKKKFLLTPR